MFYILVGTNRKDSRSAEIAEIVKPYYEEQGHQVKIMNLMDVGLEEANPTSYGDNTPPKMKAAVDELLGAEGLLVICPEYNGSMPGALKFFIDHWKYPDSFEHRPVAFIGLGGMFGGLRPVEHLQQVFGYRNAYIFPDRVFMQNVWNDLKGGKIENERTSKHLKDQAQDFSRFIRALKSEKLHGGDYIREK